MENIINKARAGIFAGSLFFALLLFVCWLPVAGGEQTPATDREGADTVRDATMKLKEFLETEQIPSSVFQNAAGVAIVPSLIKAGLIAGGRYGNGVLLTHDNDQWSAPVFISIGGGSIGAQIGVMSTDLLLVFNNRSSIQELLEAGEFNLGADAIVTAGPAGAGGKVSIPNADIYAYRRSEGLFAGISLTGGELSIDQDKTRAYYTSAGDENMRGYYGAESDRLVGDILGMKEKERIGKIPADAQNLIDVLKQAATAM